MTSAKPWIGAARPMSPGALKAVAGRLGCELAVIEAVWEVESAGRGFRADGSLERRFEPHHMPGATAGWRDYLRTSATVRDQMFADAYAASPTAALRATSWGAAQVMGFNAQDAGYATAEDMVRRMADDADEQVWAFVRLVQAWGLRPALIARDWRAFARRYNGPGQVDRYAGLLEAAYRRRTGQPSAQVLRYGDTGPAVKRLQAALGIPQDGVFGPGTQATVTAFQERRDLTVDGIVGARTWAALEAQRDAVPMAQPTRVDQIIRRVRDVSAGAGAVGAGAVAIEEALPPAAYDLLAYGAVALVLFAAGVFVWQRMVRRT